MKFNEYQVQAKKTARYRNKKEELILTTLGLAGETGEVVGKLKKLIRDKDYVLDDRYLLSIKKELGDVLWYISSLSGNLGIALEDVAITNLETLKKGHKVEVTELNEYQAWASEIGRYASKREELILPMLELAEETGEVIEKIKKLVRDRNYVLDDEYLLSIKKELGDVLWYISSLGNILGVTLEDIAITNLEKLKKRHEDDTINGEGDER